MNTVRVQGLNELQRDLRRGDRDLRKQVDKGLLEAATGVVAEARSIAEAKGLRETGDLVRGIKPFVRIGAVGVASSASHRGFAYPKRLEYENRKGGKSGPRASLNPAVDRKEKQIVNRMETVLDDIYRGLS